MRVVEFQASLINWDQVSGLSDSLSSLFRTATRFSIRLEHCALTPFASQKEISEYFHSFLADLLLLAFSSATFEPCRHLLQIINSGENKIPVVAILTDQNSEDIMELLRLGVCDFITSPLRLEEVSPRIWRILEKKDPVQPFVNNLKEKIGMTHIVGKNRVFLDEVNKIPLVANCNAGVIIAGETGTGKEVFARAIHYLGSRSAKPFIPISCGAIPPDLVENELFGHAPGAFTGASSSQNGLIQEANGGSLFLDEIDNIPLSVQAKLLRFLQEKEYKQLGSPKIQYADVRIIVATNIDLMQAVRVGKFRQDLYYRLNIIPITLPALRNRGEDILLLAEYFLKKYCSQHTTCMKKFSPDAVQKLMAYEWPGNIRELEHIIERTIVFSRQSILHANDLPLPEATVPYVVCSLQEAKSRTISQFEKKYIEDLLKQHTGNITASAKAAGKNRRAFWELIRKYKINTEFYKRHGSAHL
jgi:two-component system, NtrC family, response regulator GlrR